MKLLLDQGLPRSAVICLADADIEAIHVGDIEMSAAEDLEILETAKINNQIVVTLDSDFHTILALQNASRPSVIRIRIEGLTAKPLCRLLIRAIRECTEDLEQGAAVSIEENRIRIRRLPFLPN